MTKVSPSARFLPVGLNLTLEIIQGKLHCLASFSRFCDKRARAKRTHPGFVGDGYFLANRHDRHTISHLNAKVEVVVAHAGNVYPCAVENRDHLPSFRNGRHKGGVKGVPAEEDEAVSTK